jgi:hypothetical protein
MGDSFAGRTARRTGQVTPESESLDARLGMAPCGTELLLSMAGKKLTPLGPAAGRPSTTKRRFAKLRMIRDQVAAFFSIFAFFGVFSGETVFCPVWILSARLASGSLGPSRTGGIARDDRRGRRRIGRF